MWSWAGKRSSTQSERTATAAQNSGGGHRLILLLTYLACVEIAFSITILVVVTEELADGDRCLLSDGPADMCAFSYAASILGALFSLTQLFALCRPPATTMLATMLAAIFWLGYSITATAYAASVDNAPGGRFRVTVCALGWSTFVCHALSFLLAVAAYRSGWKQEALFESAEYMIPTAVAFKERQAAAAAEAAKSTPRGPGGLARLSAAAAAALQRMSGGVPAPAALGRASMGGVPPVTVGRPSMGPAALGRSSMTSVASEILAQPSIASQYLGNGFQGEAAAAPRPPPTVERV